MKHSALMNLFYATDGFFLLSEPFYATDYLFYQRNLMITALFPCIWCKFLQSVLKWYFIGRDVTV